MKGLLVGANAFVENAVLAALEDLGAMYAPVLAMRMAATCDSKNTSSDYRHASWWFVTQEDVSRSVLRDDGDEAATA